MTALYKENKPQSIQGFKFKLPVSELFKTIYKNLLLSFITLGIYRFWALVENKNLLTSSLSLNGKGFHYKGRALDLIAGFVYSTLLLIPCVFIGYLSYEYLHESFALSVCLVLGMGLFYYLQYKNMQYNLRAYEYNQRSFCLSGCPKKYALKMLGFGLLSLLSLGMCYPLWVSEKNRYFYNHLYYGNKRFSFLADVGSLYINFLFSLLLCIPTLGLAAFYYKAKEIRFIVENIEFENLRFKVKFTNLAYFKYALINTALLLFTGFLAYPYVLHRRVTFFTENIKIDGELNWDALEENKMHGKSVEGLMDFFALGFRIF
jgi:uncharacterized membrane protein YjgN (DUF898 family)